MLQRGSAAAASLRERAGPAATSARPPPASPRVARDVLHRAEQRLGLHHHPRPAAERHVVDDPVPVGREVAQVVHRDVDDSPRSMRPRRRRPRASAASHHRGKDRDDVELSRRLRRLRRHAVHVRAAPPAASITNPPRRPTSIADADRPATSGTSTSPRPPSTTSRAAGRALDRRAPRRPSRRPTVSTCAADQLVLVERAARAAAAAPPPAPAAPAPRSASASSIASTPSKPHDRPALVHRRRDRSPHASGACAAPASPAPSRPAANRSSAKSVSG